MQTLLREIKKCEVCKEQLEFGCNPILTASIQSKIIVIGQAPGKKVHESGLPWDDKSGENLRRWMNVDDETFYNPKKIALIPMGFCYPGKGKSGDLPPRKECAPLWHPLLKSKLKNVQLILLIGQYAQKYYLPDNQLNLTETVKKYRSYLPDYFPLPHPSPRNNIWLKKNEWFEKNTLKSLRKHIKKALN
ncbi:MAG: uracil-DNA glycosylase family protein [Bacteroidia bacterium]|nr:uracil-DNA glycosylase family protein [Bacteroidia bacterium]